MARWRFSRELDRNELALGRTGITREALEFASRRLAMAIFAFAGLLPLVAGCSTIKSAAESVTSMATGLFSDKPKPAAWRKLILDATSDANLNTPVAVDIVFVKDAEMIETLLGTPASKWFASRTDMTRSFPQSLSVLKLEIVPKQTLVVSERQLQQYEGLAAILFADYATPGEHRQRLNMKAKSLVIRLGPRGFSATEVDKS